MNQILTIVKKDLWHSRWPILVGALLLLGIIVTNLWSQGGGEWWSSGAGLSGAQIGWLAFPVVIVARIVLADPTYSLGSIWRQRPIDATEMFLAKGISVVAIFGLLWLCVFGLELIRFQFVRAEWIEYGLKIGLSLGSLVLGAAFLGTFARTQQTLFVLVGAFGVVAFSALFALDKTRTAELVFVSSELLMTLGGIGLVAACWLQYREPKSWLSARFGLGVIAAIISAFAFGELQATSKPINGESYTVNLELMRPGQRDQTPFRFDVPQQKQGEYWEFQYPKFKTEPLVVEGRSYMLFSLGADGMNRALDWTGVDWIDRGDGGQGISRERDGSPASSNSKGVAGIRSVQLIGKSLLAEAGSIESANGEFSYRDVKVDSDGLSCGISAYIPGWKGSFLGDGASCLLVLLNPGKNEAMILSDSIGYSLRAKRGVGFWSLSEEVKSKFPDPKYRSRINEEWMDGVELWVFALSERQDVRLNLEVSR